MNAHTISIIPLNGGGFEVRRDGLTTGELTWDEMLGQVAAMTIPVDRLPELYTMAEPGEWERQKEQLARTLTALLKTEPQR